MKKIRLSNDEKAVSPVIGVILMVAITVILAATIAAFVFGMPQNMQKSYTVSATITQLTDDQIQVIYNGGPDSAMLEYLNVTVTASDGNATKVSAANPEIGQAILVNGAPGEFVGRDTVVIIGHFIDGMEQVVSQTRL